MAFAHVQETGRVNWQFRQVCASSTCMTTVATVCKRRNSNLSFQVKDLLLMIYL